MFEIVDINNYKKWLRVILNLCAFTLFIVSIALLGILASLKNYGGFIFIIGTPILIFLLYLFVNFIIENYKNIGTISFNLRGIILNGDLIEYATILNVEIDNYRRVSPKGFLSERNEIFKIQLSYNNQTETLFVRRPSTHSEKIKLDSVVLVLMYSNKEIDKLINLNGI